MTNIFNVKRVPGLLTDEELALGMKEFEAQQKAGLEARPLSESALGFAEKVLDDEGRDLRRAAEGHRPPPPLPDAPASNVEGPARPSAGLLGEIGMLVPGSAEQQAALEDVTSEFRGNLANEDAATAHLQALSARIASEQGRTDDPEHLQAALELEAARRRDAIYGQERLAEMEANPPTQTKWRNAIDVGVKSIALTATSIPQWGVDLIENMTWAATGANISDNALSRWFDSVDEAIHNMLPGDKARAEQFFTMLASGAGSMTAFMVAGYAGRVIGLPAGVSAGLTGMAATGNQQYEEAQEFSANGLQKFFAFFAGSFLGLAEGIPIEGAIARALPFERAMFEANKRSHGAVLRLLNNTVTSSLEEFAQETFQATGQDLIALAYDPDRELDMLDILKQGAVGGILGAGMGTGATVLAEAGVLRAEPVANVDAATQQRFAEAAMTLADARIGEAIRAAGGTYESTAATARAETDAEGRVAPAPEGGAAAAAEGVSGDPARPGAARPEVAEYQPPRAFFDPVYDIAAAVAVTQAEFAPVRTAPLPLFPQLDEQSFDRWFKQSAARTESGAPLVVFHGTPTQPFSAFDPNKTGVTSVLFSEIETHRQGFFFAESKDFAQSFADQPRARGGGAVMPVFLSIQKPFDMTDPNTAFDSRTPARQEAEAIAAEIARIDPEYNVEFFLDRVGRDDFWEVLDTPEGGETVVQAMRNLGFDGIRMTEPNHDTGESEVVWVAFDPTQIKSATGNDGSYDPDDPNIDSMVAQTPADPRIAATIKAVAANLEPSETMPLPGHEAKDRGPIPMVVAAARAYAEAVGLPHRRQREYVKVDVPRAERIAQAYADMKHEPDDPAVREAYKAMVEETIAQYQYVKATGLVIEPMPDGQDPYPSPKYVLADIARGHMYYFRTDDGFGSSDFDPAQNPLLEPTAERDAAGNVMLVNDLFRVVHDFFGHGLEGSGFGPRGEENAWQAHMRLYSPEAVPAMTSETRGQNSWVNYGPYGEQNRANPKETIYADQKTGLMPSWTWTEGVADSAAYDLTAPVEQTGEGSAQRFHDAIAASKAASPYGAAVYLYTPEEYAQMRLFLAPDGLSGFALNGEDIVSVFSHPAGGGGRAPQIIDTAVANGGRTLDAFDGRLVQIYSALGFREVRRVAWDEEQRPEGWKDEWGKPDVVFMEFGQDVERSVASLGTESAAFKEWFGDSKAVDAVGRPLVVYHHGSFSETEDIPKGPMHFGTEQAARERAFGKRTEDAAMAVTAYEGEDGIWHWEDGDGLTSEELGLPGYGSEDTAIAYGRAEVIRQLEDGGLDADVDDLGNTTAVYLNIRNPKRMADLGGANGEWDAAIAQAKAEGFDGIVYRNQYEDKGSDSWIAFEPTQIKSVNNVGTYSPTDPDILRMTAGTSTSRLPYRGELTRPAKGVPEADPDAEPVDVNLADMSKAFSQLLDLTVRQKVTGRGLPPGERKAVFGEYDRRQATIRLRTWNDLSTLVHEGGHAFNDAVENDPAWRQFFAANDSRLRKLAMTEYAGDLSKATVETRRREGFAEAFRLFVLNPAYLQRKYPQLHDALADAIRSYDSNLADGLEGITTKFGVWMRAPSTSVLRTRVVSGHRDTGINAAMKELREAGVVTWMREQGLRASGWVVNRFAAVNHIVDELKRIGEDTRGAPIDLLRADDPYVSVRLARNSSHRAQQSLTQGVLGYRSLSPTSRSLQDAYLRALGLPLTGAPPSHIDKERAQDFSAYLVARTALADYERFEIGELPRPSTADSKGDIIQAIKDFEARYGDAFTEAAQWVHEYGMALWALRREAGLISKEVYAEGRKRSFYAPLQRDVSDKKLDFGTSVLTSGDRLTRGHKRRGSDRNIIDPMAVLMEMTFAVEQQIARNDVVKQLARLADRAGKAGSIVERVPATQLIGTPLNARQVATQLLGDEDISEVDAADMMLIVEAAYDKDDVMMVYRSEQAASVGQNALFFWEDGKMAAIVLKEGEIARDAVNVINSVGRESLDMITTALATTSSAFRAAITYWPDFLIMNFLRDQPAAWILTEGYIPFYDAIRGAVDEVRQTQIAKDYNASRGTLGGMLNATLHKERVNRDIETLASKGYAMQVFGDVKSGWDIPGVLRGTARFTELGETSTRLGVYRRAYERAIKEGLSPYEAGVEAAYLATDLIDFGLKGSSIIGARALIPFLNAQLQGLYKMFRTFGGDEVARRRGLRYALSAYFKDINKLPLSRVEKQHLRVGRKAWFKMLSLGVLSAALHFLQIDDEDYQEASPYLRATGWVIVNPDDPRKPYYFPKPFELAIFANAVERLLEFSGGDPTALDRFLTGLQFTLAPPMDVPLVELGYSLASNTDLHTGQPIVPEYLQREAPYLQFDRYTTNLGKWIGRATGQSPMVVDHIMGSLFAGAYRDIARVIDSMDPNRLGMQIDDAPITRRLRRDIRRGGTSSQDFYAYAGARGSVLSSALSSYKTELDAGNTAAAEANLSRMGPEEKAWALLMTHHSADAKRLHPYYRATQATRVISQLRRNLASTQSIQDTSDPDNPITIRLTSKQKAEVDDMLSEIAMREMRNSLIAMGEPGWADREILPMRESMDLLAAYSMEVYEEVERRYAKARIYDAESVAELWPEARDRLLWDREEAVFSDLIPLAKLGF